MASIAQSGHRDAITAAHHAHLATGTQISTLEHSWRWIEPNWAYVDRKVQRYVAEHGICGEADGLHRAGCLGPPVSLPPGCTAVDSQILLIVKADGRFKERHVTRRDQQVDGDNFDSTTTYAPEYYIGSPSAY